MTIQLSPSQDRARAAVRAWLGSWRMGSSKPFFYLAGFAGTGKTTIARVLPGDVRGSVVFASYTGKAADVMRRKGCHGAKTIHSLIYKYEDDDESGAPQFCLNDEFDYAYAITGHKSQGSEWGSVLAFDESGCFRDQRQAWLYTVITRAAERLTVLV